jgi:hypothetical protein
MARAEKTGMDFIPVFAAPVLAGERAVIRRLMAGLEKRFSRYV